MQFHRRDVLIGLGACAAPAAAQTFDFGRAAALGGEARTLKRELYDPAYRAITTRWATFPTIAACAPTR